jgi:hypothetical protein
MVVPRSAEDTGHGNENDHQVYQGAAHSFPPVTGTPPPSAV